MVVYISAGTESTFLSAKQTELRVGTEDRHTEGVREHKMRKWVISVFRKLSFLFPKGLEKHTYIQTDIHNLQKKKKVSGYKRERGGRHCILDRCYGERHQCDPCLKYMYTHNSFIGWWQSMTSLTYYAYKRAPAIDVINCLVWRRHAGKPEAWQRDKCLIPFLREPWLH